MNIPSLKVGQIVEIPQAVALGVSGVGRTGDGMMGVALRLKVEGHDLLFALDAECAAWLRDKITETLTRLKTVEAN